MGINLEVKIGNVRFKNPVWVASGTFGYGEEFEDFLDLNEVGAIVTKTVTLKPREGNAPPRVVESASGLLNSIGLANKGVEHLIDNELPRLNKLQTNIIVSIAGSNENEYAAIAGKLSREGIRAIELNLSCPNVAHHGTRCSLISQDARAIKKVVSLVRRRTKCIIISKLSPNVTDIAVMAKAALDAGSDAVSLINTYPAMAVDAYKMSPLLGNVTGGLSGPAIKPIALKAVWDVYNKVKVPIIGIGGIMTGLDIAEFMLCGSSAVQIGTANLVDPACHTRILGEFKDYLKEKKIKKLKSLIGRLRIKNEC